MLGKNSLPGGPIRIDEFDIPVTCPGELGVPCESKIWVAEIVQLYFVARFHRKDRRKDKQVPFGIRWRCGTCSRLISNEELENVQPPPVE